MIQYKNVTGTPVDVEKEVQQHLTDGWTLQGGAFGNNATKTVHVDDCDGILCGFLGCKKVTIIGQTMIYDKRMIREI